MPKFYKMSRNKKICDICGDDKICKFVVSDDAFVDKIEVCEFCVDKMHEVLE